MTEAEWLASEDPQAMLAWLTVAEAEWASATDEARARSRLATDRKMRLFAVAYSRLYGTHYRELAHVVAEHADVTARAEAWADGNSIPYRRDYDPMWHVLDDDAGRAAAAFAHHAMRHHCATKGAVLLREIVGNPFRSVWPTAKPYFAAMRRDHPHVARLALAAYEERSRPCPTCRGARHLYHVPTPRPRFAVPTQDELIRPLPAPEKRDCDACHGTGREDGTLDPARLLILSDALEEAGCSEVVVLDHLRSVGPHVRGCWVLDLLLGKA